MSSSVWTENTKPDRPGIWQEKNHNHPHWVTDANISGCLPGTWAFLMDLPTIVDPPRYREVNQGDVGREVEVAARNGVWWKRKLTGFKTYFVAESPNGDSHEWQHARILDEPVKKARGPREWWVNPMTMRAVANIDDAYLWTKSIHVREVIDEVAE